MLLPRHPTTGADWVMPPEGLSVVDFITTLPPTPPASPPDDPWFAAYSDPAAGMTVPIPLMSVEPPPPKPKPKPATPKPVPPIVPAPVSPTTSPSPALASTPRTTPTSPTPTWLPITLGLALLGGAGWWLYKRSRKPT